MERKDFGSSIIQDGKLISLCRRLKKFTRDEILSYLEIDKTTLDSMLLFLTNENILIENNGIYSYINSFQVKSNIKRENKNLHCMFQHHSREKIDLLIRVFCLDIPTHKASCLADLSINCIADFYAEFRKLIYERQYKTLLGYFFQKGQIGRHRIFFKQYAYFYVYNNQVFVSEKFLQETNGKCFTKAEVQELKKMYSYLARKVAHKSNQIKLHQKLAEGIWRKDKDFIELYQDLKVNLLNIS